MTFRLEGVPEGARAFVRTTLGRADLLRRGIIAHVEADEPVGVLAWHDLEMHPADGGFELTVPLLDPGCFEAKCCCRSGDAILWPEGDNFLLKVEAAENVAAGPVYCAFTRQFRKAEDASCDVLEKLDRAGYAVIPPSGTFREVIRHLDLIFDRLHCRILQLLPIHPVPTVYGRMGRFGSPFASLDHFAVDPALAEFDPKTTPLEQFRELVDAVHARRGRLFLDIPVNHTGWASRVQNEHPEYFVRRPDGTFESPGAWGVVWADLCKLDYRDRAVWKYMADVFLYWCRQGVDGFRCDAGYMLPADAWSYITAKVRLEYPDAVFMLEGLGGPVDMQDELLVKHGLDWAYSELFQNYDRNAVSAYFPRMDRTSLQNGVLVNFAETHDNDRLAAKSRTYAAMRCALCALLSENGAFGFANGVEFFATEKIDVHGASRLPFDGEPNLVGLLGTLNRLVVSHPAFAPGAAVSEVTTGGGNGVAFVRRGAAGNDVLALVNLDCDRPLRLHWRRGAFPAGEAVDLLSGEKTVPFDDAEGPGIELAPGGFRCLALHAFAPETAVEPARVHARRASLVARRVLAAYDRQCSADPGPALLADPWRFLAEAAGMPMPPVTEYCPDRDVRRLVPIPPGEWLLIVSPVPFHAELRAEGITHRTEKSLTDSAGREFVLFPPMRRKHSTQTPVKLDLALYPSDGKPERRTGTLLCLPPVDLACFRMRFDGVTAARRDLAAFGVNRRGGYTMMRAAFGHVTSKYDAVLAVNGPSPYPEDRHILLTRLRAWLTADGYSSDIDETVLTAFAAGANRAEWRFLIPSGQGRLTRLTVELHVSYTEEGVELVFSRDGAGDDETPEVSIILRPDLESRVNHEVTRAYTGPETRFPAAVRASADGFTFAPEPAFPLHVAVPGGRFVFQPEWKYMERLPMEARYGLACETDLFSPGYCELRLARGESKVFRAWSGNGTFSGVEAPAEPIPDAMPPTEAAVSAMRAFPVERGELRTVIAGYPWFLDWGRDTLISLRGIIAAGRRDDAADILCEFAGFEENGTIPNIIHGAQVGNRDTSDAPLWLGQAAADYREKFGDALWKRDCRGRTFAEILESIVRHYRAGTPNGIRVDDTSALVFSPAHFTWMDTNYPAGTPREGYPIEIQALWAKMLALVGDEAGSAQVRKSLDRYFYLPALRRFSDCLHGTGRAADAKADDHVRPNQLLAVTLGAVNAPERRRAIVRSAAELLTPGAVRSLSDRPVAYRLPVMFDGRLLNDPEHPYQGRYQGPEDTSRKAAYHNGTAWGWLFPSWCEALFLAGGSRERALGMLYAAVYQADRGIPGQLPEIADGDAPHTEQGCLAQAWSMTEFYRVARLLSEK